jgi:hypothetical protein
MVSRRKILSRSRDDLHLAAPGPGDLEEEDVWFEKEKLYKVGPKTFSQKFPNFFLIPKKIQKKSRKIPLKNPLHCTKRLRIARLKKLLRGCVTCQTNVPRGLTFSRSMQGNLAEKRRTALICISITIHNC